MVNGSLSPRRMGHRVPLSLQRRPIFREGGLLHGSLPICGAGDPLRARGHSTWSVYRHSLLLDT